MHIRRALFALPSAVLLGTLLTMTAATAGTTTCSIAGGNNCTARIPDAQGATAGTVTSTLNVPACTAGTTLGSVSVGVKLTHTWIGDLQIMVTNPAATSVFLLLNPVDPGNSVAGCQGDDINATFADSGAALTCGATIPAISGTVLPAAALAPLLAQPIAGSWTLTVKDTKNSNDGILKDWSVITACSTLDIDGNKAHEALADGIMIMRYLFGLTGTALTTGAIGSNPARTDPVVIKAYLDQIRPQLDIDLNGSIEPLTDGLLILRYMFALRGATLTDGALGAGAMRNPQQIEDYIKSLIQ